MLLRLTLIAAAPVAVLWALHHLSYRVLKHRIIRSRERWDLNVCCGSIDGGGINADIARHADLPNFVEVDIYNLPFKDGAFETVLCSHTIEHVEDPERFFAELRRVGREVTLILPPLWDLSAVLTLWEHRWVFLTFRKKHHTLPPFVRLPGAAALQRLIGQRVRA